MDRIWQDNSGLLITALSQLFFAIMNASAQVINELGTPEMHTVQLIVLRQAATFILCLLYMIYANVPDPFLGPKGVRLLLLGRGSAGFFGLFGIYYSVQQLSLSDATVITFLTPICTGLAAASFLNEPFSRTEAVAGGVSLLGVILIARPSSLFSDASAISGSGLDAISSTQRLIAVGVALVGVLGSSATWIFLRAIGTRASPLHSIVAFSGICVVIGIVATLIFKIHWVFFFRFDWLGVLFLIGLSGFIAQTLMAIGLQREKAGRAVMVLYTQIIFAGILEYFITGTHKYYLSSLFGTIIILSAAIYVAVTKRESSPSHGAELDRLDTIAIGSNDQGSNINNHEEQEALLNSETQEEEEAPMAKS